MDFIVVRAKHLQSQYVLKLPKCEDCPGFGIVRAARHDIGRGRTRERVNPPHQRSHQPLDMPTEPRRRRRAILNANAMLLAPALKST